jgi:short-subunit dehydrogenase
LNKDAKSQAESPFDESKLMSAEAVADYILNMIKSKKAEQVLTLQGKLSFLLQKFVPRILDKLVYNTIAKEKDSPFK